MLFHILNGFSSESAGGDIRQVNDHGYMGIKVRRILLYLHLCMVTSIADRPSITVDSLYQIVGHNKKRHPVK